MNFPGNNILIPFATILAVIIIFPGLVILLTKAKKQKRKTFLKRLNQFKISPVQKVSLQSYPLKLVEFGELLVAFGLILGLPLLLGKFAGAALPNLFHLSAEVVFPLRGEFVLMGASFLVFACVAMMFSTSIILFAPNLGTFLGANRILVQLQFLGVGYTAENSKDRHKQLEQIAGEYNLRAFSISNLRRQTMGLLVAVVVCLPVGIWLSRTGVWIDQTTVTVNPLVETQRIYPWDQVTGIEISIEDVGGRRTTYSPTFKLFFSDQTSVDLWESSFVNVTDELRDTCGIAQQHDISIYISPLATGRLSKFNQRVQQDITSVINSPLCRTNAYTLQF